MQKEESIIIKIIFSKKHNLFKILSTVKGRFYPVERVDFILWHRKQSGDKV